MAVYAIGDIQGCYDPFRRLLDKLEFDPGKDRVWLTGDLVNRGPKSLKTLRFVRELGDAALTVLGNHDLHLVAVANGFGDPGERKGSLAKLLRAEDCEELIDWLRMRPLAHFSDALNTLMVHAGLHPRWDPLLARDHHGMLRRVMEECVDGEYQNFKSKGGAYVREHFFGRYPETKAMVADMSDDEIWHLNRGGHDPLKVHAAYHSAVRHKGQPTIILAKTVKGFGMGAAGEGQNITPARLGRTADEYHIITTKIKADLERAAKILRVTGYARIDAFVRVFDDLRVETVIIEVNSLPGMTPATCIFHQAALQELKPAEFIDRIIDFGITTKQANEV